VINSNKNCGDTGINKDFSTKLLIIYVLNYNKLPPYVGSHMIRDPRQIIVSGYFYHLKTDESWCKKEKYADWYKQAFGRRPKSDFGEKTYQQILNGRSKDQGILFEMQNVGKEVINQMLKWDCNNPSIIELKYEDVIQDQKDWFPRIFRKYGFDGEQIKAARGIALNHNVFSLRNRIIGLVEKVHRQ
jgi:hypothetical protein